MQNVSSFYDSYADFLEKGDPRTREWPLMRSPMAAFVMTLTYFAFVYLGPGYMSERKPFKLNLLLQIYNLSMVCMAGFIVFKLLYHSPLRNFYGCYGADLSDNPHAFGVAVAAWTYLMSKFVELLDTVFIILRKKTSHLTFLHVFHHGFLPLNWWFGVKFAPGGAGSFHVVVNAAVHVVMYGYYFLAAFGPEVQKHLWWKKYITKIQITQFVVVMIHTILMLLTTDCQYPRVFLYMVLVYEFCFLILFANFYIQTYKAKKEQNFQNAKEQNELKKQM